MTEQPEHKPGRLPAGLILWGAVVVVIFAVLVWAISTGRLTWSMAVDAREAAMGFVAGYPLVAYAAYIAMFVVAALVLLPIHLWTVVFAAILFGFWPAVIVCWIACMLGALLVFSAAKGVLAGRHRKVVGKYLGRVEQGFHRNQLLWILTLRLIPVMPYSVCNVVPAFLGARILPFAIATGISSVPFVMFYAFAGDRAGAVLNRNAPPDLMSLTAEIGPVMIVGAMIPVVMIGGQWLLARRRGVRRPAAQEPPQPPAP